MLFIVILLVLGACVPNTQSVSDEGPVVLPLETAVKSTPQPTFTRITSTAEPSPTPAVCTPLPEGMNFTVMPISDTKMTLELTGLQPGEALHLIYQQKDRPLGGGRLEETSTLPVGEDGRYTTTQLLQDPNDSFRTWKITVIHARGVACTEVTFSHVTPTPLHHNDTVAPILSLSPDGQWRMVTHISDQTQSEANEIEQFPNGKYHVNAVVEQVDGEQVWTLVDEWRGSGLGETHPEMVRWSENGRFLYYANISRPDGCGMLANGGDLWQIDLESGVITEIAPYIGLVMALSPDETQLAVHASYGRGFLIRDLAAGEEQPIPLPQPEGGWKISGIQWSPDGEHLLLTQAVNPCGGEMKTAVVRIDIADLSATSILEPDARNFTLLEWTQNDEVQLRDEDGWLWYLDPFSGELAFHETTGTTPPSSPQIYCPDPQIDSMAGTLVINGNDSIYTNPVLGVKLTSPHKLCVHEPDYLFDSYGFTLSDPDIQDSTLLSIDWLYQATPEQLNTYVQQTMDSVPELEIVHETIMVNGIEGVALWPLPGTEATTHIYLVANDRLYHLIFWSAPLDEQAQVMLDNLSFIEPTQTLDMLNLPEARP